MSCFCLLSPSYIQQSSKIVSKLVAAQTFYVSNVYLCSQTIFSTKQLGNEVCSLSSFHVNDASTVSLEAVPEVAQCQTSRVVFGLEAAPHDALDVSVAFGCAFRRWDPVENLA